VTWVLVILILFGLVLLVGLSYLRIHFLFSRVKDNDLLSVQFKLLGGLLKFCIVVPYEQYRGVCSGILIKLGALGKKQESKPDKPKQQFSPERLSELFQWAKRALSHVDEVTDWLRDMVTHMKCSEFRWDTRIGVGDAAETAVATGMLWALKSSIIGFVFHYVVLQTKPMVTIQPQYNNMTFTTALSCDAKIRLGHIILSVFRLGWRIIRSKGSLKSWQKILSKASG
jgi:hypothetical protein